MLPNQPNVKQGCDDAINAADDLAVQEPFPEIIFIHTCMSTSYPQVHKSESNSKIETCFATFLLFVFFHWNWINYKRRKFYLWDCQWWIFKKDYLIEFYQIVVINGIKKYKFRRPEKLNAKRIHLRQQTSKV